MEGSHPSTLSARTLLTCGVAFWLSKKKLDTLFLRTREPGALGAPADPRHPPAQTALPPGVWGVMGSDSGTCSLRPPWGPGIPTWPVAPLSLHSAPCSKRH